MLRHIVFGMALLTPLPAYGQAQDEDAPRIDLDTPAPQPAVQRSYHVHDGFYLRLNIGLGFVGADFDDGSPGNVDLSAGGSDLAFDVMVGGSPSPGVAIGGGLFTNSMFSADFERNDRLVGERDVVVGILGPFIDGFPNPKGGWHLGGAIGVAAVDLESELVDNTYNRTEGVGGVAWFGYDAWVGDEWSVGGLVRISATRTLSESDSYDVAATTRALTLMFTGLYH